MNKYASAQAVESAFYRALEQADLDTMMNIWSAKEEVVCIHPGAPRMEGLAQVRESWEELFRNPPIMKISLMDVLVTESDGVAVHQVREEIEIDGQYISMMISTNVYERGGDSCWRMTSRHSSPEPEDYALEDDPFDDAEDDEDFEVETVVLH